MDGNPRSPDRALAARLTGGSDRLTPDVIAAARQHRVHLLLAESLSSEERADPALSRLTRELQRAAALDVRSTGTISGLLSALAHHGVDAVLMKGEGLAHTLYPAPHLRARADTDILISHDHLARAEQVLSAQGWERPVERTVDLTAAQYHYTRPTGLPHHIDLHWRIANPRIFGQALSFAELRTRAVAVPALGPHARTLGPGDALFVACVHRVAHHADAIEFQWLWDIHLLIQGAAPGVLDTFVQLADREHMCGVCARGVDLAAEYFRTTGARALATALAEHAANRSEASARFIRGARPVAALGSDLQTIEGWRSRVAYLSEHLFPSRAYMRSMYPSWPPVLLPVAYGYRIARGARRWFARP